LSWLFICKLPLFWLSWCQILRPARVGPFHFRRISAIVWFQF